MNKIPAFLLLLVLPASSFAGADEDILARFRDQAGYKCTDSPGHDGYVCVGGGTNYVLIPKGLEKHAQSVFYAHGDTGVCGPGASGENYLKDQMPTLKRANAVAFFPYRRNARDMTFDFAGYIANAEKILGDRAPWVMAAHSFGGKFVLRKLKDNPGLAKRVTEILLLDAAYDVDELMLPPLKDVMKANPRIRIKAVATTTLGKTNHLRDKINESWPGAVTVQKESGEHCDAPKYFKAL